MKINGPRAWWYGVSSATLVSAAHEALLIAGDGEFDLYRWIVLGTFTVASFLAMKAGGRAKKK